MATEHLLSEGCRHVAHLRGPEVGIANDRSNGYCLALQAAGVQMSSRYVVQAGFESESGYEAMRGLLESGLTLDGVFCYNDPIAVGAIKAIHEAGCRVPRDIAVVGAGNVNYADSLAVPLTSIDQVPHEIGKTAASLLLAQIESGKKQKSKIIIVPHKLVVRESSERVAGSARTAPHDGHRRSAVLRPHRERRRI